MRCINARHSGQTGVSCDPNEPVPGCILRSALQAGAPTGLSATGAWGRAAAGDGLKYAPSSTE
jgi:hypothetical protein